MQQRHVRDPLQNKYESFFICIYLYFIYLLLSNLFFIIIFLLILFCLLFLLYLHYSLDKGEVECMKLDLASQQSIRDFADEFKNKKYPLHVLINNGL